MKPLLLAAPLCIALLSAPFLVPTPAIGATSQEEEEAIEIVHGSDRTVYEYRVGGILRVIKVVPDRGRPYYLVPVDGNAPFEGLDHARRLYPQWVILEW